MTIDWLNLFAFVSGNLVSYIDNNGNSKDVNKTIIGKGPVNNWKKTPQKDLKGKSIARVRLCHRRNITTVIYEKYVTATRSVTSILKINGKEYSFGENGKAAAGKTFYEAGAHNQPRDALIPSLTFKRSWKQHLMMMNLSFESNSSVLMICQLLLSTVIRTRRKSSGHPSIVWRPPVYRSGSNPNGLWRRWKSPPRLGRICFRGLLRAVPHCCKGW